MRRSCQSSPSGFTLIELLVVIAIIGVLSSVILASVHSARVKAEDAFRKDSIHNLQISLELYYNKHGQYPYGIAFSPWSAPGFCAAVGYGPADSTSWANCDHTHGDPMNDLINDGDLPQGLPLDPESYQSGGAGYLSGGYNFERGFVYCSGNPHGNCSDFNPTGSTQTYILGTNLSNSTNPDGKWGNYFVTP